ncbi:MAG: hypothetical protein WCX64_04295 [Candidatus Micrarchaeia archaeon]
MAFLHRIRESVSRARESVAAMEKRADDYFTHMRELREEKALYGLDIHVKNYAPGDNRPCGGKLIRYYSAVFEPKSLSADELEAFLNHPVVKARAPVFRLEQFKELLEKKRTLK